MAVSLDVTYFELILVFLFLMYLQNRKKIAFPHTIKMSLAQFVPISQSVIIIKNNT